MCPPNKYVYFTTVCGSLPQVELTRILPLSVSLLILFQVHCFYRCACPWPGLPWGPGEPWSPFSPGDPIGPRGPTGPAWPSRPGLPLAPGIPGVPGVPGIPGTPTLRSLLQLRYGPHGFWIEQKKNRIEPEFCSSYSTVIRVVTLERTRKHDEVTLHTEPHKFGKSDITPHI